jgi:hypothetical protein
MGLQLRIERIWFLVSGWWAKLLPIEQKDEVLATQHGSHKIQQPVSKTSNLKSYALKSISHSILKKYVQFSTLQFLR